jgi:nucleotide-binding universal stress UspA family protein
MYKHILVPTDGSPLSAEAVKQAVMLARPIGAKLTVMHVMPNYEAFVNERYNVLPALAAPVKKKYQEEFAAASKKILDDACAKVPAAGIECAKVSVTGESPYEAIIKQAAKSKCDLIMMASHGRRGLKGVLLGSETQKVLTHSKIPVLIVR